MLLGDVKLSQPFPQDVSTSPRTSRNKLPSIRSFLLNNRDMGRQSGFSTVPIIFIMGACFLSLPDQYLLINPILVRFSYLLHRNSCGYALVDNL